MRTIFCIIISILVSACASSRQSDPEVVKAAQAKNAKQCAEGMPKLKRGMTPSEVNSLLGGGAFGFATDDVISPSLSNTNINVNGKCGSFVFSLGRLTSWRQ